MKRRILSMMALALTLATVCAADTDWTSNRTTSDYRVSYQWRRIDYGSLSPDCEIRLWGPSGSTVRATITYDLKYERTKRQVTGYFVESRSTDVIAGCDGIVSVFVDSLTR